MPGPRPPKLGSFLALVLTGFSLVALPLIGGLVWAARTVDQLAAQSRRVLYNSVRATESSRALVEQVVDLERKARQAAILGDGASRAAFDAKRALCRETLARLTALPIPPDLSEPARRLERHLSALTLEPDRDPAGGPDDSRLVRFAAISDGARRVLLASNRWAAREADGLQQTAAAARRVLLTRTAALVPAAAGLAVWFAVLIFRPVGQLHRAVLRLGEGDLRTPVRIRGPRDLEALGERLDWLRGRLSETTELRKRFLAHVSHDLKTPLTAIREGAELLAEGVLGELPPEPREVAEILRQNAVKLHRSIQALLDFGASQAREPGDAPEPFPLRPLIERVLADHKPSALKKEISLEANLQDALAAGQPDQVRVIVDNLVSNAVKFTPSGGRITVSTGRVPGWARVEVRDSGPGIAQGERERVFEAFYQGASRAQGPIKGSGLGLSIAAELAAAQGGKIEIVGAEDGAHFRLSLPLAGEGAP